MYRQRRIGASYRNVGKICFKIKFSTRRTFIFSTLAVVLLVFLDIIGEFQEELSPGLKFSKSGYLSPIVTGEQCTDIPAAVASFNRQCDIGEAPLSLAANDSRAKWRHRVSLSSFFPDSWTHGNVCFANLF